MPPFGGATGAQCGGAVTWHMADLTLDEQQLQEEAVEYARRNKKAIARELTDPAIFKPEANSVAVFMAGSPGAGKTESSKELLAELESKEPKARILRVDPDDLRCRFPSYTGKNSYLFQGAISILPGKMVWIDCTRPELINLKTMSRKNPIVPNLKTS